MTSGSRQYSPVERQGINAGERIILGYQWTFRELPIADAKVGALADALGASLNPMSDRGTAFNPIAVPRKAVPKKKDAPKP